MPGRLPQLADFDDDVAVAITPSPAPKPAVNVLVLLHGMGDTNASFANLAKQLSFRETACISLQAPTPLPFDLGGFHWGDDIIFDPVNGGMDVDTGFTKAVALIRQKVVKVLVEKCKFEAREILFLGYGQGGMAALAALRASASQAAEIPAGSTSSASADQINDQVLEYGGLISIGGPLPVSVLDSSTTIRNRTPILVLGGSSDSLITEYALKRLKDAFTFVEYSKYRRPGDTMPRSRDEMMPIMQFFSRRLRSRAGVPEGSIEVA